jgi:hypothetical protein
VTYRIQLGFAPGDWETVSEWPTRQRALEVARDLPPVKIARYKFPLPVRVKKFPDRCSTEPRRQIAARAVVLPPVLRKRSQVR